MRSCASPFTLLRPDDRIGAGTSTKEPMLALAVTLVCTLARDRAHMDTASPGQIHTVDLSRFAQAGGCQLWARLRRCGNVVLEPD